MPSTPLGTADTSCIPKPPAHCTIAREHLNCTPASQQKSTKQNKLTKARQLSRSIVHDTPTYNPLIAGFPRFNVHSAFPTTMRCTLPYCEVLGVQSTTTANTLGSSVTFVPNSMYAPLASGHQPYSFDQLCSANGPYTRYKVLGFKVKLTLINNPLTENAPLMFVVRLRNITDNYDIGAKFLEDAAERPTTRIIPVPASPAVAITEVHVPDLSVLFNWSKEQYSADVLNSVGSYGTSPSSLVGLQMAVSNPCSTTARFVNVTAEWLFDVVFTERQTLPAS